MNRVWKRRGETKVVRTVKHSAKVNLWGCFSESGFGKLVLIRGILKSDQMVQIYQSGLLPSANKLFGTNSRDWVLLEDNDPKHRSKLAKTWKLQNGVKVMDWPSQSPDCNPIENVWALLKAKLCRKKINSVGHLLDTIKLEWKQLSAEYARKLAQSCPKRCQAVIQNGGDWIPY